MQETEYHNTDDEDEDLNEWQILSRDRAKERQNKRNMVISIIIQKQLLNRITFINDGTCLLDNKVYYYIQKHKARVKGKTKYYYMRDFEHFIEVFG